MVSALWRLKGESRLLPIKASRNGKLTAGLRILEAKLHPGLTCLGVLRHETRVVVLESRDSPAESPQNSIEQRSLAVTVRSDHHDRIGVEIKCLLLWKATEAAKFD